MPMSIRISVSLEEEAEEAAWSEELNDGVVRGKEEAVATEHRPNFKRASKRASLMEAKMQRKKMKEMEKRTKRRRSDLEGFVISIWNKEGEE